MPLLELNVAQAMSQDQILLQQMKPMMDLAVERDEDRTIVNAQVEKYMRNLLEVAGPGLGSRVRESRDSIMIDDLIRLMVSKVMLHSAPEFTKIVRKNHQMSVHKEKVKEVLDQFRYLVEAVLVGQDVVSDYQLSEDSMERDFLRVYDGRLASHYETLVKTNQAKVRPITRKDIPLIRRFYNEYKITGEGLLQMLRTGESSQSLLNDFDDEHGEGPTMERLLYQTEFLKSKKTENGQREQETMHGWILHGPHDPNDVIGVCVHTVAPLQPKLDKDYYERETAFIDEGISGGTLIYPDDGGVLKDIYKHFLLETGRNVRLFFVGGKAPMAATRILSVGMDRLEGIDPEEQCFTYAMAGLNLRVSGKLLLESVGQNHKSIKLLTGSGYDVADLIDRNSNAPFKRFQVEIRRKIVTMLAQAFWKQLRGKFGHIRERAHQNAGVVAA